LTEPHELLARTPVLFRYADGTADLSHEAPTISLDLHGRVSGIRFNTRSTAPLRLAPELVEPYYDAYRAFAALLVDPALEIRVRLEAGDLILPDNERVLHARTAFSGAGDRLLQSCYADRDGLRSRLAVLRRENGSP
jgi:gamma-butyrobetaine dioxygenase